MSPTSTIPDLIAAASDRLTPTERRIAEAVLQDPTLIAFGTVSDLAERVDTSRPSIVRFATKLGLEGYSDLQGRSRDGLSRQLSRPSERLRSQPSESASSRQAIEIAVRRTFEELDAERLDRLVSPIIDAPTVWIVSGESSLAGAHAMLSGLAMVRPHVRMITEHDLGRSLSNASPGDAAVVFDFARYRRSSVMAARALSEIGVSLVAVTDGPLSPLAALTENWCELSVPAIGPFDSSVPAVLAAELLVNRVVRRLGPEAQKRIDRLEKLWIESETFVSDEK